MAIGKGEEDADIAPENVTIGFGDVDVYPDLPDKERLAQVVEHLKGDEVLIKVRLGTGHSAFRVYGCDLTEGYVRLNADYST